LIDASRRPLGTDADNRNRRQYKQETTKPGKRDKMAQKKQKKIKVRDLKTTKDVKGGGTSGQGNKKPK